MGLLQPGSVEAPFTCLAWAATVSLVCALGSYCVFDAKRLVEDPVINFEILPPGHWPTMCLCCARVPFWVPIFDPQPYMNKCAPLQWVPTSSQKETATGWVAFCPQLFQTRKIAAARHARAECSRAPRSEARPTHRRPCRPSSSPKPWPTSARAGALEPAC